MAGSLKDAPKRGPDLLVAAYMVAAQVWYYLQFSKLLREITHAAWSRLWH